MWTHQRQFELNPTKLHSQQQQLWRGEFPMRAWEVTKISHIKPPAVNVLFAVFTSWGWKLSVCTVSSAPSATWSMARAFLFTNLSSRGHVILIIFHWTYLHCSDCTSVRNGNLK
jgi:hypothetical protein